ncbi:flippase [Desulfovulcanus sp.]
MTMTSLYKKINTDIHFKELLSGSVSFFFSKILGIFTSYAFTIIVTRAIGASAWGIFALSLTVLQVSSLLGRIGLDTAVLRFVAGYAAQGKWLSVKKIYLKILGISVLFSLFVAALLFFVSPYISENVFRKEYLAFYFRIASIGLVPFVLFSITKESIRGLKKIKEYAFFNNISVYLFSFIFCFVLFLFYKENYVPVVSYVASLCISLLISVFFLLKTLNFLANSSTMTCCCFRHYDCAVSYKNIMFVSIPMLLSSSLFFLMQWADTIMIGIFCTENDVGVYTVSLKIATATSIGLSAINSIAAPKFAEFWGKRDVDGLGRIARQSTRLIFFSSLPILLFFWVAPSYVLGIFGSEFKTGKVSLMILTFAQFVNAISGSVGYILNMTGKEKMVFRIISISIVVNVLLNFFLIPRFGINGASFASLVSIMFWNIYFIWYIKKSYGFSTLPFF